MTVTYIVIETFFSWLVKLIEYSASAVNLVSSLTLSLDLYQELGYIFLLSSTWKDELIPAPNITTYLPNPPTFDNENYPRTSYETPYTK